MDPPACGTVQTTFKYRPLDSASKQIRVLKLRFESEVEDIECHLEHVSLKDNPEFTALSYVWGDVTDTRTILLHHVPFPVTKNLHAALRSIRSNTPDTRLWVDALCINQQDLAERSCQIPLMQLIYGQAKRTIVWFGPGNELSKRAVQLITEMINTFDVRNNPWFNGKIKSAFAEEHSASIHPLTHLVDRLEAWEAVGYLVNLPWWTRVWVAQEIEFSKDPILLWGENALRWIDCQQAMIMISIWQNMIAQDERFQEVRDRIQLSQGQMKTAALLRLCQPYLKKKIDRELLFLMDSFWPNEATDPRDKVYALLGLATDNHSESIVPNYKSPIGLVYAESVKDAIIREGNLQVFSHCSGLFTPRDAAIPSWAPDWRSTSHNLKRPLRQRHITLHLIDTHMRTAYVSAKPQKYVFRAAGGSPPAVGFCKQMKTLYTVGIRVDVISKMSITRSYNYLPAEVTDGWSTLSGYLDYTTFYPPTGQLRHDACMETLSAAQFTPASQTSELAYGIGMVTSGRRFFVGEAGYQGLALSLAQIKDVIVVPLGGACPLILREMEGHYIMVGEAYGTWSATIVSAQIHADTAEVHGIMNGELMTFLEHGQRELEEFEIW